MPVRILPQTLINQIAAGEVIVRMASVLKELVENSIDAGATRIRVEFANQLRDAVVTDDGSGMSRDDAEMSLQRHATSKIASIDDLIHLRTRGFRGEALASIAAVSRMELATRRRDELSGTRIVVEGGILQRLEPVGAPPGTRIAVRDLFFNTPARLKFLKSPVGELNAVLQVATRQALAADLVGFRVEREGEELLDLPAEQGLRDRFAALLGSALTEPLAALSHERPGIRIGGWIAPPQCTRGDRRWELLYVNGRPFTSRTLAAALEQACKGHLMVGRFPMACVMIDVPPEAVDFNVHPTKEEVRFEDEREVAGAVFRAVEAAIGAGSARGFDVRRAEGPAAEAAPPPPPGLPGFFTSAESLATRGMAPAAPRPAQRDWLADAARLNALARLPESMAAGIATGPAAPLDLRHGDRSPLSAGPGERPEAEFWSAPHVAEPLGQLANTYIVARFGEDLLLVDQHAAHERLRYLELLRRPAEAASQALLLPPLLEVPPAQQPLLRESLPLLERLGFHLEEFGPRTWRVAAVPADAAEVDAVALVIDLLEDFERFTGPDALARRRDALLIRTACHSAIRAGDPLPMEQMRRLLAQMRAERLSFQCPHGRPTVVRVARGELERWFKRVV
ncbi:MAG: DNA mismatch repair endonuclease MutL [Candidatus Sumerlaeia bacterium]|nr:DNA mismatch repair endonuclease MutL [Candidatus Sumerlaeia bacterium]